MLLFERTGRCGKFNLVRIFFVVDFLHTSYYYSSILEVDRETIICMIWRYGTSKFQFVALNRVFRLEQIWQYCVNLGYKT